MLVGRFQQNNCNMQLLKDKITNEGKCLPGGILKVDNFINHQMDPLLMQQMAEELVRRFSGHPINKILTIEASGIAPAIMVGAILKVPVLFAKKKQPSTMEHMLTTEVFSFTKGRTYTVCVSSDFLGKEDHVLFIDDFLANGEALRGLARLVSDAGAQLVGAGIVIEKAFQPGGDNLRAQGMRVESLARVAAMSEADGITFVD